MRLVDRARLEARWDHGNAFCGRGETCSWRRCGAHSRVSQPPIAPPGGQNTQWTGQPHHAEIILFIRISDHHIENHPTPDRGALSRSSRHAGWDVVDAGGVGAKVVCRVGNRERTPRAHDRCSLRTLKPCRPGARSLCAKSRSDVAVQPGACISDPQGDGAIVHRSPGRTRHKPSNHCAGKAGCLASPVCRCANFVAQFPHSGVPALLCAAPLRAASRPGHEKGECRCSTLRHCERHSEAIHNAAAEVSWIASLRSQ